jgi:hypothetical protein
VRVESDYPIVESIYSRAGQYYTAVDHNYIGVGARIQNNDGEMTSLPQLFSSVLNQLSTA